MGIKLKIMLVILIAGLVAVALILVGTKLWEVIDREGRKLIDTIINHKLHKRKKR